jgi:hypothetical protein
MGWDGSRGCVAMGHDFISVSIVGAEHKDAVPLYMKLGKGRHCKEELLYDAIDCVMEKTDGKGWMVVDRQKDPRMKTLGFGGKRVYGVLSRDCVTVCSAYAVNALRMIRPFCWTPLYTFST